MPLNPCEECGQKDTFQERPKLWITEDDKVIVECPCGKKTEPHNNFEQAANDWNN